MIDPSESMFRPRLEFRRRWGRLFQVVCALMVLAGLAALGALLGTVVWKGWRWLSWEFLTRLPSNLYPERAGIKAALWGTVWLGGLTAAMCVPVGVAAAVYLEEYAPRNRLTRFIHLNIANLAGVPSIVYGILGMAVFVRAIELGESVLAGAMTLSLLVLPVVIIASREALLAVPQSIRAAAYALGATRWQTVRHHVLPAALPGIMTGVILALSRAIGEAAPLVVVGAATYITFVPQSPLDSFSALPLQIFDWAERPQREFHELAAAGILVLLAILFCMNAAAVAIRARRQRM